MIWNFGRHVNYGMYSRSEFVKDLCLWHPLRKIIGNTANFNTLKLHSRWSLWAHEIIMKHLELN